MATLTHFDSDGNAVMVDVSAKDETERVATAAGAVVMHILYVTIKDFRRPG